MKQLLLLLFICTCILSPAWAQNYELGSIDIQEASALQTDMHPKYKKWSSGYTIDKIEYTKEHTIMHFRFKNMDYYSSVVLYAPGESHSWFLEDKISGIHYDMLALKNIQHNGESQTLEAVDNWYASVYRNDEITCEVYFPRLPSNVKKIDLIEGASARDWKNHFHCLNIRLKTQKPVVSEEETLEPDPVAEETQSTVNANTSQNLNALESVTWTVYPNPSSDQVSVELEKAENAQIEVLNIHGQRILLQESQDKTTTLDLSHLASGTYLIQVNTINGSSSQQVIVK